MKTPVQNLTKKTLRIGIDARFYGPLGKGLGRYVQELVDNLIKINDERAGEFEYVIFLSKANFDEFQSSSLFIKKKLVNLKWYSWEEQFFFPKIIKQEMIDLMHFPHFNVPIFSQIPFVVTIHDLILTRFPSRRASILPAALYWFKQLAYRLIIKTALLRAKKIITVSNFTKEDIVKQFKIKPKKILVTYEGISKLEKTTTSNKKVNNSIVLWQKYKVKKPFILYVGNAYPHKNLESLLFVTRKLINEHPDLKIVMVGKEDYFYRRLKDRSREIKASLTDNNNLHIFPGFVPDEDLAIFYQNALFYIFPSLYEGFGLPPLEAMSFSCPVLSSDQASLPEIIGEAALFFNPYDESDLESKIKLMINDDKLRYDLSVLGQERVKLFNWLDCAENTREVYQNILL